jgi:hypothetical protein
VIFAFTFMSASSNTLFGTVQFFTECLRKSWFANIRRPLSAGIVGYLRVWCWLQEKGNFIPAKQIFFSIYLCTEMALKVLENTSLQFAFHVRAR